MTQKYNRISKKQTSEDLICKYDETQFVVVEEAVEKKTALVLVISYMAVQVNPVLKTRYGEYLTKTY
jgi:hypothetical protein